jgi:surface carbohydrate biosynthesis protein (TIGR04326 family)
MSTLWVCFTRQGQIDPAAPVLSFLSPIDEDEFEATHGGTFVSARQASTEIRSEARECYFSITTRLGLVEKDKGRTFRQSLAAGKEASRWWYHAVSFRDCEGSPIYDWIIAVLTICRVAGRLGATDIVVVGGSSAISNALRSRFNLTAIAPSRIAPAFTTVMRGIAERARYLLATIRQISAARLYGHRNVPSRFDVMFAGFLDWSFWYDDTTSEIKDRYFKKLPAELQARGLSPGWLAWIDPHAEPGKVRRHPAELFAAVRSGRVVLLQQFLRVADVVSKIIDLRPLISYLRMSRRRAFRQAFVQGGVDFRPLFARDLLAGFANSQIPHCELVALATERACRSHRPRLLLTFLEHFPHSRALYEGVRRSCPATATAAMQHASYCHEKTFYYIAPKHDFAGEPDGRAVPHPDRVFVMGTLGRDLFGECGYAPDAVITTGSARYDGLSLRPGNRDRAKGPVRVLMVSSLNTDAELQMVEGVVGAARGLKDIELFLRNHPFRRMESDGRFAPFAGLVKITSASLDDDLRACDVVLFTYSTVAEEAFLRGKAVWQWLPLGFNGSALAEVARIPRFGKVADLRNALQRFCIQPDEFLPDAETQRVVVERLFHRAEGCAGAIADVVASMLPGAA